MSELFHILYTDFLRVMAVEVGMKVVEVGMKVVEVGMKVVEAWVMEVSGLMVEVVVDKKAVQMVIQEVEVVEVVL